MEAEIEIPDWARHIVSDHTDMDRSPHPVDSSSVSSFRVKLPDDAYFEYAFLDADGRMRADPGNPRKAQNPWYPEASAVLGPDYRPSRYADLGDEYERGTLDRHRIESNLLGAVRRVGVYTPGGHEGDRLPLLLVHDGTAFMRIAALQRVLEALLEEGKVEPARVAFVEPMDRTDEYGFDEQYRRFTVEELLPFLDENYSGTGERTAVGASLGGLMSATLALLHPELFGTVVTFSGAFLGGPENRDFYRAEESWVLEQLRSQERLPLSWYSEVGTIEWLTTINREVEVELEGKRYVHGYRERNAGHNWVNWRNGLADALLFALGDGAAADE